MSVKSLHYMLLTVSQPLWNQSCIIYHLLFIIYLYNTFNYNSKVAQIAVQKYKITSKVTYNISNKHQIPNNSPTVLKASEKKKVF